MSLLSFFRNFFRSKKKFEVEFKYVLEVKLPREIVTFLEKIKGLKYPIAYPNSFEIKLYEFLIGSFESNFKNLVEIVRKGFFIYYGMDHYLAIKKGNYIRFRLEKLKCEIKDLKNIDKCFKNKYINRLYLEVKVRENKYKRLEISIDNRSYRDLYRLFQNSLRKSNEIFVIDKRGVIFNVKSKSRNIYKTNLELEAPLYTISRGFVKSIELITNAYILGDFELVKGNEKKIYKDIKELKKRGIKILEGEYGLEFISRLLNKKLEIINNKDIAISILKWLKDKGEISEENFVLLKNLFV